MKPKWETLWKATGVCAVALLAFGINARRVSKTDSEVIGDAAMAVAYTKGGQYIGYLETHAGDFMPRDFSPGGYCLIARNWVPKTLGTPSAPNVFAWELALPSDDDEWRKAMRDLDAKHPHFAGILSFSLPVYSPLGDRAYLYYEVLEGPLYGGGGFVTMQKKGDHWVKVQDDVTIQY